MLRVTSIELEKDKGIVVSHEDSTEQVNQENQIKELLANAEKSKENALLNEFKLKQTNSLVMIGGWEFDLTTNQFLFNDNFYEIYQPSISQIGGYKMSSEEYTMRFVHPDDKFIVESEIYNAIETVDPNYSNHLEHRIIFNDGETGHISVNVLHF